MNKLTHIISYKLFENYNFVTQNYRNLFNNLKKQGLSNEAALELWTRIYHVRQALKSQNREKTIQTAKTLEEVEDILTRVDLVSRAVKWHKLAPSKFRKELKNQIEKFADMLVGYDDFEDFRLNFMNKAKAMSNVNVFFSRLEKHIQGQAAEFNQIVDEINTADGIQIETITDNQIIAWVFSYSASKKFGSASWCISRGEGTFNEYVFNELRKQYFIWDFNYPPSNIKSFIGVTLNTDNSLRAAHWKNDRDAMHQVKQTDWWKHILPLSSDQMRHWLRSIKETGLETTNYKSTILHAFELDDIDLLIGLIKNNANKLDDMLVSQIIDFGLRKSGIEIFKQLEKINPFLLSVNYGKALVDAKKNNRKDIYNFVRSKLEKRTINFVKVLAKRKPTNFKFREFLDAYNQKM